MEAYFSSYSDSPGKRDRGTRCIVMPLRTEVGESPSMGPDLARDTSEKVDLIRKCLLTAHSRQKSYANRWRRPLEFEVCDHVFLKVMPKR